MTRDIEQELAEAVWPRIFLKISDLPWAAMTCRHRRSSNRLRLFRRPNQSRRISSQARVRALRRFSMGRLLRSLIAHRAVRSCTTGMIAGRVSGLRSLNLACPLQKSGRKGAD